MPQTNVHTQTDPGQPGPATPGAAPDAAATTVRSFAAPKSLAALVNRRLALMMQLDRIDGQRQALTRTPGIPQNAAGELSRQTRELRRIPTTEIATATKQKLEDRLADIDPSAPRPDRPEEVEADEPTPIDDQDVDPDFDDEFDEDFDEKPETDEADLEVDNDDAPKNQSDNQYLSEYELELEDEDEEDEEEEQEAEEEPPSPADLAQAPQADPLYVEALQLGIRQAAVFIQRDAMTDPILTEAARCQAEEALYTLLEAHGCDPTALFGWTAYAAALQGLQHGTSKRLAVVSAQLQQSPSRRSGRPPSAAELGLDGEARLLAGLQTAISRELRAVEPVMVAEFWRVYEEAAALLVSGQVPTDQQTHLRALLRYGVIGQAPWLLAPTAAARLLAECAQPLRQWTEALDATHVLHADEYIDMVAAGNVTPSTDQDLELNGKGTDPWKADRLWRKIVYAKTAAATLSQVKADLDARLEAIATANEKLDALAGALPQVDKAARAKRTKLREKVQANKIEAARFQRGLELIEQKHLPEQRDGASDASAKLETLESPLTPEVLARRESAGIRQVCKLCAKLKEPFLPFVMRDKYKPDGEAVNERQAVLAAVGEIERRDPNVFRTILTHHKKAANRIYVRYSPYIVLVPTQGIMGISWNPRGAAEVGRLVLPAIFARPGGLTRMLYEVVADFRYDTSKEEAGVDLLTSDTLVAAYATVRWNYRKRSKEIREKAAIYNEENDRKNWRRHYQLHISSAMDGGKKLFFKCAEVYEAVCKYMGLPEGVDKLG